VRWAAFWLSLGFALKWMREAWAAARARWGPKMFDVLLVGLSFALVWLAFGVLHVTTWQALLIFLFWGLIVTVVKVP